MLPKQCIKAILGPNVTNTRNSSSILSNSLHRKLHTKNNIPVKEIKIPVQWGYIAGKLWGSDMNQRPILALHGWQDNAGTWDPIAPMIIKDRPLLAIDLPGHGLSSWIPPGMQYYSWQLPSIILALKEYFNWDKVSLLGHSMGSIACMRYTCTFPDDVDFYVGVDILIYDDYDLHFVIDKYPKILKKCLDKQSTLEVEPLSYTMEEIIKKWHLGTGKSVDLESVQYLAKRGVKPSKKDPNKYYFCRDSRLKYTLFNPEDKHFVQALIRRQKCPTLFIKAIDSPFATDEFAVEMREIVEQNNVLFESQFIPGTHHVHLNNPDKVAPLILNFYKKYSIPH